MTVGKANTLFVHRRTSKSQYLLLKSRNQLQAIWNAYAVGLEKNAWEAVAKCMTRDTVEQLDTALNAPGLAKIGLHHNFVEVEYTYRYKKGNTYV